MSRGRCPWNTGFANGLPISGQSGSKYLQQPHGSAPNEWEMGSQALAAELSSPAPFAAFCSRYISPRAHKTTKRREAARTRLFRGYMAYHGLSYQDGLISRDECHSRCHCKRANPWGQWRALEAILTISHETVPATCERRTSRGDFRECTPLLSLSRL